jgi:hypothetical protein
MKETGNAHNFWGKLLGECPHVNQEGDGTVTVRWILRRETWMKLAQDCVEWWTLVLVVLNLWALLAVGWLVGS